MEGLGEYVAGKMLKLALIVGLLALVVGGAIGAVVMLLVRA